jgi:hypothetical protein
LFASLPSNFTCQLFGWGQTSFEPRSEPVNIYSSNYCDPNSPEVHCSTVNSVDDPICYAGLGSPLVCDNLLSGFTITEGCITDESRIKLNYHSMFTYRVWIEQVLHADSQTRLNSHQFVAHVMLYEKEQIVTPRFRCASTIIDHRHVLTTAACVSLPKDTNLAVGVQGMFDGIGLQVVESENVFIHPKFASNEINNIAVIRVRQITKNCLVVIKIFCFRPPATSRA